MGSNNEYTSLLQTLNVTDINTVDYDKIDGQFTPSYIANKTIPSIGWIKNDNEMGITDPNTTLDVVGVGKNIDKYQQYFGALTTGKSSATKIQNNGQPLGNREFITLPNMKCFDSKFTLHQKQSIVDGMAYYNGDKTNTGVALSAYQTLQDVKDLGNNASNQQNMQDISCVQVKLIKDGYGNTEKGYISTNEYYVWQKKDPPIVSLEPFCVDQDTDQGKNIVYGKRATRVETPLGSLSEGLLTTNLVGDLLSPDKFGKGSFLVSERSSQQLTQTGVLYPEKFILTTVNSPRLAGEDRRIDNNTNIYSVPYIMSEEEDETKNPYYRLVIDDDIITSLFLGTITVLGLYIIYRMFEKDIR